MEIALTLLAIACFVEAGVIAVMALSVPYIYWKCWKLEGRIAILDETLARMVRNFGIDIPTLDLSDGSPLVNGRTAATTKRQLTDAERVMGIKP